MKPDDITHLRQQRASHIGRLLLELSQDFHQRSITHLRQAEDADIRGSIYALMPFMDTSGTSTADIIARSGISKQAVARTLSQMEAEQLIYRTSSQEDKRAKMVYFTDTGLEVLQTALKGVQQTAQFYEEKIGSQDFNTLTDILETLAQELKLKRNKV